MFIRPLEDIILGYYQKKDFNPDMSLHCSKHDVITNIANNFIITTHSFPFTHIGICYFTQNIYHISRP